MYFAARNAVKIEEKEDAYESKNYEKAAGAESCGGDAAGPCGLRILRGAIGDSRDGCGRNFGRGYERDGFGRCCCVGDRGV